ncbi:hypothetical protein HCN44_007837 [Aphidius gifuensis]|uniref:MAGE domain-containing protein n=1 Tax=Aphidius gifuensis TaxID=684658 RepID=A0A835CQJ5_APHGI|nr:non-structural maintenance of chromosomes element 3 homolog [Aphidius gifuensis]KAF7989240.1 hypothetical protein HCN44_007837 [Aphidius gifuensis]
MSLRSQRKTRQNNVRMEIEEPNLPGPSQSRRTQEASQRHRQEEVIPSQSAGSLSDIELEALAGVVIRYILAADRLKIPVTSANIKKNALPDHGSHYKSVMGKVRSKLHTIFGMTLVDAGSGVGKQILINNHHNPGLIYPENERGETVLLFLCLAHIFMAGGSCTTYDLSAFLQEAGIPDDRRHEYFGNIPDLINNKFIHQLYLQKSKVSNNEASIEEYKWGSRAEKEIDKGQVLEFVAMVHKRPATSWPAQYRIVTQDDQGDEDDS